MGLVAPLKPFTRTGEAFRGRMKSVKLLEMHEVAPPSTRMSKESESKMARVLLASETAEFARATPTVIADIASMVGAEMARAFVWWRDRHFQ